MEERRSEGGPERTISKIKVWKHWQNRKKGIQELEMRDLHTEKEVCQKL